METHGALNNLDYIVIGIVLLSGLLALMRGFMRELFSLIAWVGAYFAAVKFYKVAVPFVQHYIKHDKTAEGGAMALVFVIALIILMLIGSAVCSLVRGDALTAIDRSLGFLYGLARGALVVCVLYLLATIILWPDIDAPAPVVADGATPVVKDRNTPPDLLLTAKTRPYIAYGAERLRSLVPKEFIDKTLKSSESQMDEEENEAKKRMLDKLSTPSPPAPTTQDTPQKVVP